jgi:quercetin dioxygenase-like cupin family protein
MNSLDDEDEGLAPDVRRLLDQRAGRTPENDDALLARVGTRVMAAIETEQPVQYRTVRASDEGWKTIAPGIECKVLWTMGSEQSRMLRAAPGGRVGPHWHASDEECVVLEGSIRIGADLVLRAGDFHVGRKGSMHPEIVSDTGALVYLRGAVEPSCT